MAVGGLGIAALTVALTSSGALTSPAPAAQGRSVVDVALTVAGVTDAPEGTSSAGEMAPSSTDLADRSSAVSRASAERVALDKRDALSVTTGRSVVRTEDLADADPRTVAQELMGDYGFSSSEWGCLDTLWTTESGWDYTADNPTSSAYGIPQALTESTDGLPADYTTNPVSQIQWGLGYIRDSYGTPCSAWSFHQSNGWY